MMKKSISLTAICVAMLFSGAASAQTRYFSRVGLPKAAASTSTTPPAGAKTVQCSNMVMGRTAYPEQDAQFVANVTSIDDALKSCNDIGKQYGEIFKDYNHCRVYNSGQMKDGKTLYYSYLVKGSGVYEYADPSAKTLIGDAACTYYP